MIENDIADFNEKYLLAMLNSFCNNDSTHSAMEFNVDLSQFTEISRLTETTIKNLSKSPVLIAEPLIKSCDLLKIVPIFKLEDPVAKLNFQYLLLIKLLACKNNRLVYFVSRLGCDLTHIISHKTVNELKVIASANHILFKFSLTAKCLAKTNCSIQPKMGHAYQRHIPLMTMGSHVGWVI